MKGVEDMSLPVVEDHGGNSYEAPAEGYHNLLGSPHLCFPHGAREAFHVPPDYGGHNLGRTLLLSGFFTCLIEVLAHGRWVSL